MIFIPRMILHDDVLTLEIKYVPQKCQDTSHQKKAKQSIIMVVHYPNYEKRCSKCTISNARDRIQLCKCVSKLHDVYVLFCYNLTTHSSYYMSPKS
jgi:hypothetical protein